MADDDRELQQQVRDLTTEVKRLRHSVIVASIILGAMILLAAWGSEEFLKSAMAAVFIVVFVLAVVAILSATIEGVRKVLGKRVG
jgi:uncharacterized membrane protein